MQTIWVSIWAEFGKERRLWKVASFSLPRGFLGNVFFFSSLIIFLCLLPVRWSHSGLNSQQRMFLPVEFKTPCQTGTVPSPGGKK